MNGPSPVWPCGLLTPYTRSRAGGLRILSFRNHRGKNRAIGAQQTGQGKNLF